MARKIRVALLFGGRSAEHEVSIISAKAIHTHLDPRRFETVSIYIDRNGRWKRVASPSVSGTALKRGRGSTFLPWDAREHIGGRGIDIYFPILHGPYGEDGTIQGLLEMADVPYVGAGVLGSAAGMDKAVMKTLFKARGVPTVEHIILTEPEWQARPAAIAAHIRARLPRPLFVKPANLGSSVGVSKVADLRRLPEAIERALTYDRKILVERGVRGRELECSVLGNEDPRASLPGEVFPHNEFYDYADKYLDGKTRFSIPAKLPPPTNRRVRDLAVRAFRACEASGMARVDFFLEAGTGRILVNEINTIPGFTSISMYPKLWEVSGLPFGRLVERLIELGFERHRARKRRVVRDGG
jgi:D-alanine-D-alanine ligase